MAVNTVTLLCAGQFDNRIYYFTYILRRPVSAPFMTRDYGRIFNTIPVPVYETRRRWFDGI